MLVTETTVVMSFRRTIERRGNMFDDFNGGLAGEAMVALQFEQEMDMLLISMLFDVRFSYGAKRKDPTWMFPCYILLRQRLRRVVGFENMLLAETWL